MSIDQNIFFTSEDDLVRIDKLLNKKFETSSRTYFQYLIENSFVLVNGKAVKKSFIPKIDDEIEVFFKALPDTDLKPQKMDFEPEFHIQKIGPNLRDSEKNQPDFLNGVSCA